MKNQKGIAVLIVLLISAALSMSTSYALRQAPSPKQCAYTYQVDGGTVTDYDAKYCPKK